MKIKNILIIIFFAFNFFPIAIANAQPNLDNIKYPVSELGQCGSREDCENYCSSDKNMVACINYAEKNNLLSIEDLKISKLVAEKISKGETPGGCKTREQCESYCMGKVDNMDECVSFGESLGLIPEKELIKVRKIMKALKEGAKMPGNCKTKESCETYCDSKDNIDECLSFAEKTGILALDELNEAKKVAQYIKDGSTPGGCKNRADCQKYCNNKEHWDECLSFAQKAGFISEKEAEIAKKSGGSGPGGCKNQQECEVYCNETKHYDECVKFGMEKDILTEKEKDLIQNGLEKMEGALNNLPSDIKEEVLKCLEGNIGKEKLEKIRSRAEPITKEIGAKIDKCFAVVAEKMKVRGTKSIPSSEGAPVRVPTGTIPSGANSAPVAPSISCDNFKAVPSCSLVPAGVARDACNKCK